MEAIAARCLTGKRQLVTLFSGFALLALLLGAVGVYGVTAFMVGRRTRETAIRMALGADARSVVLDSLGRLAWPAGLGLAAGLLGAWSLSHLLESALVEVEATDPGLFLTVALVLTLTVAAAGYRRPAAPRASTRRRCSVRSRAPAPHDAGACRRRVTVRSPRASGTSPGASIWLRVVGD